MREFESLPTDPQIARLDNLLSAALDTFKSVRPTMEGRQDFAGWVKETNRIFLVSLRLHHPH